MVACHLSLCYNELLNANWRLTMPAYMQQEFSGCHKKYEGGSRKVRHTNADADCYVRHNWIISFIVIIAQYLHIIGSNDFDQYELRLARDTTNTPWSEIMW